MPEPFQKGNSREYVGEYERIFRGKLKPTAKLDHEQVAEVLKKAVGRMKEGVRSYGLFNPATDKRDLLSEAQEELLDAINYLGMQYLKLEELKSQERS